MGKLFLILICVLTVACAGYIVGIKYPLSTDFLPISPSPNEVSPTPEPKPRLVPPPPLPLPPPPPLPSPSPSPSPIYEPTPPLIVHPEGRYEATKCILGESIGYINFTDGNLLETYDAQVGGRRFFRYSIGESETHITLTPLDPKSNQPKITYGFEYIKGTECVTFSLRKQIFCPSGEWIPIGTFKYCKQ